MVEVTARLASCYVSTADRACACGADPSRRVGAPPRLPAVLAGLKIQAQQGETTGDIKTDAAFDADWLQRDRIAGASN